MTAPAVRLTGRVRVALSPGEAFRLFTPLGEQDWVAGWSPRFPAPVADDSAPGTVFETDAHGATTTWVVTARSPGHVAYARVTPGDRAGTVSVTVTGSSGGHSEVEVTYSLTALTDAAVPGLRRFADRYPAFLRSWEAAIAEYLARDPAG